MKQFRLRTVFLLVLIAAIGSLALTRYLVTRPPEQGAYSKATLKELLADGKTVLITIDAVWSMNPTDRPRYMSPEVSRRIRELDIETLTANASMPTPAVAALMRSLNKNTVPTLALFSPNAPTKPIVLPHQPSDADILQALDSKQMAGENRRTIR